MEGAINTRAPFAGKRCYAFAGTGRAFLHSGFFKVAPSTTYKLSLYAKGSVPQAEVFWWVKEGVETNKQKRAKVALKKAGAKKGWTRYEGVAKSAPDAKKAYVRIIANGALSVDAVSVTAVK